MRRWWLLGMVVVAGACQESLTSPGACPDYCPAARLQVRDTVLTGAIGREEWFRGYVTPDIATSMNVASDGTAQLTRAVVRFSRLSDSLVVGSERRPIAVVDSFRLRFTLIRRRRDISGLEVRLHRLPVTVDTTWSFADLDPFFQDSTLVAAVVVPDTVLADTTVTTDSLVAIVAGDGFPTLAQDSQRVAVGLAIRTDQAAYADFGSRQGSVGQSTVVRYAQVDSSGTLVEREESRTGDFDTFVAAPTALPGADAIAVGGTPSARAFLRLSLPDTIFRRASIVRATLLLVPAGPALGAPGDTMSLRAFGLEADYGPKSRFVPAPVDSIVRGEAKVAVGSLDTIRIDVTHVVQQWQADTTRSRSLLLRIVPEAATLSELHLATSQSAGPKPAIRITYVPLFLSEGGSQ